MKDDKLNQTVQAFQSVIEAILASHAMLQAQVEVLEAKLLEALEHLGWKPPTHASLGESLRQDTIDHCNRMLAHVADSRPGMASKLKALIEEMDAPQI